MKQSPENSKQTGVVLLTENGDGITTVTLNRPNQYNALSEQVLTDMQLLLDQLSERHDVKVVVIASTGDAFCTGHDLKRNAGDTRQGLLPGSFQALQQNDDDYGPNAANGHHPSPWYCDRRRLPVGRKQ